MKTFVMLIAAFLTFSNQIIPTNDGSYKSALYEPAFGCYTGAYILSNKIIEYDIREFESLTQKQHCTYLYYMKLGDPFPINWYLACIASGKTPYFVVNPSNDDYFSKSLVRELASDIALFKWPTFVDFFPNPNKSNLSTDAYIDVYTKAREIFREVSPSTAFVWSVDMKEVYDCNIYYPGNETVDWVGINIVEPLYSNSERFSFDVYNALDYFYYSYEISKPIYISSFAVSHYSTFNHSYDLQYAADNLSSFYGELLDKYQRIKGINYLDFNNVNISTEKVSDNFSITDLDAPEVLDAYRNAVSSNYFLEELQE